MTRGWSQKTEQTYKSFYNLFNQIASEIEVLTQIELESVDEPQLEHDSSTNALIRRYRRQRSRLS